MKENNDGEIKYISFKYLLGACTLVFPFYVPPYIY